MPQQDCGSPRKRARGSVSGRALGRLWIPVVLVVVGAVAGLTVLRLHRVFASEDLNADAGAGIQIVQFNPKVVVYEVFGPAGATATVSYLDAEANLHTVDGVVLPWTATVSTTLPAVTASIVAQSDTGEIGCRVTVDGTVRDERSVSGVSAQTYCLVKSA